MSNVPEGWAETTLGELVAIKYGKDHKHLADGDYPLYGSGGIMRHVEKPLYDKESILIPRKGTLSNLFYVNKAFWSVDTIFYTEINRQKAIPLFLFYKLKTIDLAGLNVGSAVPSLTTKVLNPLSLSIPPLPEQKAVADMLSSLDDKIELLREQNKTLETLAQTIFKEWFCEFEFPQAHPSPDLSQRERGYKSSGGEMVESELGLIPKGWRVGKLGEVTNIKGGGTPSTKNEAFWNGDIHWTSPKDLSNSKSVFLLDTEKKLTQDGLKKVSSGLLPKGTLLLSSRAPIGYVAISNVDIAVNQGYIALLNDAYVSNYYMLFWLRTHMRAVTNAANGSTFLEISKSAFRNIDCVIPSEGVLKTFDEFVKLTLDKVLENIKQIQTLSKTRDTLLPKLMSGHLRIDGRDGRYVS